MTALRIVPSPAERSGASTTRRSTAQRRIEHGWWGVLLVAAGVFAGAGALSDNSFLTHWATGRLILAGELPHTDPYSFTAAGEPWTVQSWGASWFYAVLESVGGPAAIRIVVGVATGAVVGLLWRLSRPAGGLVGRMVLVGMASVVGFSWWSERPQVFAFVCMGLAALVVAEDRNPWWLVPIFAIWANLHGSFPLGLVFLGVWLTAAALEHRRVDRRAIEIVVAAVLGVGVGALVSPYGFEIVTFPIRMLSRSSTLRYIVEWRPPELGEWYTTMFIAQVVAVLWVTLRSKRWITLAPLTFFVLLAASAARNVAVASIALVPLSAPAFAGVGELQVGPTPTGRRRILAGIAVGAATLIGVAMTSDLDLTPYPVRAIDRLEARGWVANPSVRLITHDYVGNYLEWRYGDEANVWIDDRAELLPPQVIEDYVRLLSRDEPYAQILDTYDANVVVWDRDELLADELEGLHGWRVVESDRMSITACRVGSLPGC